MEPATMMTEGGTGVEAVTETAVTDPGIGGIVLESGIVIVGVFMPFHDDSWCDDGLSGRKSDHFDSRRDADVSTSCQQLPRLELDLSLVASPPLLSFAFA